MGKKLGLVKDLGTAFVKGALNGIVTNVALATTANAAVKHLDGQEFDIEESLKVGLVVGASIGAVMGTINTVGQMDVIKQNYKIREAEEDQVVEVIVEEEA